MLSKSLYRSCIVVALLLGLSIAQTVSAKTKKSGPLDGIRLTAPIAGKPIRPADLHGKVVFFEYWGTHCPPCRTSFPHLVELQKKYGPSGRFQLIASHVQGKSAKTMEFIKSQNVNFPIYQQLRLPKAPCGGGIPDAVLFDHTGKIIAHGHPASLYSQVEALVKAAPRPNSTTSPLIGEVDVEHNQKLAKSLVPGRQIKSTIAALQREAKRDTKKGQEAKLIIEAVNQWIDSQIELAKKSIDTQPSVAMETLSTLAATIIKMEKEDEVRKLLVPLKKDPDIRALMLFRKSLERLKKQADNPKMKKSNERYARNLRNRLDKLLKKDGLADNVKTEATALRQQIPA